MLRKGEAMGILPDILNYTDVVFGSTLAKYLSNLDRSMSEKEMLTMFVQMVDAIDYLHKEKILHRCVCVRACVSMCVSMCVCATLVCWGQEWVDVWG